MIKWSSAPLLFLAISFSATPMVFAAPQQGPVAKPVPSYASAHSTTDSFGAGLIIGEPTGLTGKYWLNREGAIDFGVSYSFSGALVLYGDYLFHFPDLLGHSSDFVKQLTPYVGGGVTLGVASETRAHEDRAWFKRGESFGLGIRVPGGIEWRAPHPHPPISAFIELAPGISIVSRTALIFQGGIGARYYFK